MAIPVYAFVRGDTLGLGVLVGEGESVNELASRLSRAAAPRVASPEGSRVVHRGKVLRGELTLSEAGIRALDRVDLVPEQELG